MKRILFIFCFALISPFLEAQSGSDTTEIKWDGPSGLTVADFQKNEPGRKIKYRVSKNAYRHLEAFIFTGIKFSFEEHGKSIVYSVYAYMVPSKSWMEDKTNLETLLHEQSHFDITEIYARRLKKKLESVKSAKEAQRLYKENFKELLIKQDEFDKDHKNEAGVTQRWQNWINSELTTLEPYAKSR